MTPRRPRHLPTTAVGDLASESVRLVGDPAVAVTGAVLDSRAVQAGDLYAALPGANVHGASFAGNAVAAGATAVLTDEYGLRLLRGHGTDGDDGEEPTGGAGQDHGQGSVPVLVTPDPRAVLGDIAARIYDRPSERLESIGITGTNGKTTTAYILDSALRALGRTTGLVGTIETRIADERVPSVRTTPESCDLQGLLAIMVEEGVDSVTMEVSSHALALHRVDGIVYDVACFTNLSQDHLDFHGSMEQYFEAKAALFTPARARRGVVCVDDEWGRRLGETAQIEVVTVANATETTDVSEAEGDDGEAVADWLIRSTPGDQSFRLAETGGEARVLALRSPLPGHFNLTNTAVAALTLLSLGATGAEVEEAMTAPTTVPGRAESVELGADAPQVVVDYAHTPDAIASVLAALRPGVSGRLVVVVGAGGDRDPLKREGMGAAAASAADLVVVTDDNPRSEDPAAIRATVLTGARYVRRTHAMTSDEDPGLREIPGRSEAIEEALRAAGPDGCVAVLGKGHETGQQIGDVVHPYDDRVEVVAAWGRIRQHEGAS